MGLFRELQIIMLVGVVGVVGALVYETERSAGPAVAAVAAPDSPRGGGHGAAGGGRRGGPGGDRAVAVEVVKARTETLRRRVEAVGTTRALQSIDVVPLAEGQIRQIDVVPGKEVADGDVIAELDTSMEEASLAEAKANLAERQSALDRSLQLVRAKSVNVSQAALDTVQAEVAVNEAIVQRAERTLADRTVRAPFAGVLGIRAVDVGARVDTDTVLTTLDDLSEVEIEFLLPETVYGQIKAGQSVEATSAAFPDATFTGVVSVVDSRIDKVSRAFRVRAKLPNGDRRLPGGMFMRLVVALEAREAVVVPEEALLIEAGEPHLFVVEGDKARERRIGIGQRSGGIVEVLEGIDAGDTVVARGIQSLRDGATVRIVGTDPVAPVPNGDPIAAPIDAPIAAPAEAPDAARDPTAAPADATPTASAEPSPPAVGAPQPRGSRS